MLWPSLLRQKQLSPMPTFHTFARPQWKAKEGFDILVGNAAGVEFDFNGELINDLGTLGQVIRLRLPEGFNSSMTEDVSSQ